MKKVTSFTHLITGEGDRIAFTFSEIDETGMVISQNNKKNFVVANEELLGHIDAIKNYIQKIFLDQ